jgi:hypothetical protein
VKVGGLDLAKRTDFSALVTLEVEAGRVTVTRALRLPQETYDRQLEAVASILADLDRLAYDAGGVGDAVGERLPAHSSPVLIVGGDAAPVARHGRVSVGKTWLIGQLLTLAGSGWLTIAANCTGALDLKWELQAFAALTTRWHLLR